MLNIAMEICKNVLKSKENPYGCAPPKQAIDSSFQSREPDVSCCDGGADASAAVRRWHVRSARLGSLGGHGGHRAPDPRAGSTKKTRKPSISTVANPKGALIPSRTQALRLEQTQLSSLDTLPSSVIAK